MESIIAKVGLPQHICKALARKAKEQGWTEQDVETLVKIALESPTVRIPKAFVISRIRLNIRETNGGKDDKSPMVEICDDCRVHPCLCDWDPKVETITQFKARRYGASSLEAVKFPT